MVLKNDDTCKTKPTLPSEIAEAQKKKKNGTLWTALNKAKTKITRMNGVA